MSSGDDTAAGSSARRSLWQFGRAELDDGSLTLKLDSQSVELDRKTTEVLHQLLLHAGEVVTRDEIFDTVWARAQGNITDGVLANAISRLRKLLGDDEQTLIVTHPKVGYRYAGPVSRRVIEGAADTLSLKAEDPVPGREHWRLSRPLGKGGQGEVWLAEHKKIREQRVFKFAIDGHRLTSLKREATLYRLLKEVLGERPDVARVLEWNFEQSPFFLECEFGGVALHEWAAAQGGCTTVPIDERLRLLAETAEAVAAAHSAGVLHKDLKPGNVLIYIGNDGRPHPRLTDFGSSRLADAGQLDALGITRLGFTVTQLDHSGSHSGTPLYLAPELMAGQLPTVQSDVYALGVMLYQLVVGDFNRPLVAGWEQDVEDELLREDIAAAANGSASKRIASAALLAAQLHGLLQRRNLRVVARQQAQKQIEAAAILERARTRRPWVAAALLMLTLGLAASLTLYLRADAAKREAERNAETAETISNFLNDDVLAQANPYTGGDAKVTVVAAVDKAAEEIDKKFADRPLVAARLHHTVALAYHARRKAQIAMPHYRRAYELYLAQLGPDAAATLEAGIHYASTWAIDGESGNGPREMLAAFDAQLARLPGMNPQIAVDLDRGWTRLLADRDRNFAEAAQRGERALATELKQPQPRAEVLDSMPYNLGYFYTRLGRYTDAERVLTQSLEELQQRKGEKHPDTMDVRFMLVRNLHNLKRYEEAEAAARKLYQDRLEVLGPVDAKVTDAMLAVGNAEMALGHWPEAAASFARVLELYVPMLDPGDTLIRNTDIAVLDTCRSLALAQQRMGKTDLALATVRDLYGKVLSKYGDHPPTMQRYAYTLAALYLDAGQPALAKPLLEGLDPEVMRVTAQSDDWPARLDYERGRLALAEGDKTGAEQRFRSVISVLSGNGSRDAWLMGQAKALLPVSTAHGG